MTTPLITRLEGAAYLQEALAFQAQIADVEGKITTASVCREAAAYIAMLAASPKGEGDWITHDGGPNPVPGKTVDVSVRGLRGSKNLFSDDQQWEHTGLPSDIIFYRATEGVKP